MKEHTMSKVVQGFWRLNEWRQTKEETNHFLNELIEHGVTTMDHADIYGGYTCEGLFGDALALTPALREQMQIVTKCGIVLPSEIMGFSDHRYDYSRQHIIYSVERSLKELQTDYIDLLLLHRPSPLLLHDEVAETLSQLKQQGKVLEFGVSNFKQHQWLPLQQAMAARDLNLTTNQLEISVMELENIEDGTLDWMKADEAAIMAWSPLAGGELFRNSKLMQVMKRMAAEHETTIDVIAYAWLYHLPYNIHPITGSRKIERIEAAIKAQQINLTDSEWFEIYKVTLGRDIL